MKADEDVVVDGEVSVPDSVVVGINVEVVEEKVLVPVSVVRGLEVDDDALVGVEVSVPDAVEVEIILEVVGKEVLVPVALLVRIGVEVGGEALPVSVELEQSTP